MKVIEVVAAIIVDDNKILATERGYGEFKGWWEFPGGKVEPNELLEQAIKREIKEELDADIVVDKFLTKVEYDYPKFHLIMNCFVSHLDKSEVILLEHEDAKWLSLNQIDTVEWLPADVKVVEEIKNQKVIY